MSGGAVDVCGHCGAPLDLDDDGRCRWCRTPAKTARPRARRPFRRGPGPGRRPNWRLAAIAGLAVAAAVGLGVGLSGYIGSHQSGPPAASGPAGPGAVASVPPGSTDLQALRQDFGPWRQLTGAPTGSPALLLQAAPATRPSGGRFRTPRGGGPLTSAATSPPSRSRVAPPPSPTPTESATP